LICASLGLRPRAVESTPGAGYGTGTGAFFLSGFFEGGNFALHFAASSGLPHSS